MFEDTYFSLASDDMEILTNSSANLSDSLEDH